MGGKPEDELIYPARAEGETNQNTVIPGFGELWVEGQI